MAVLVDKQERLLPSTTSNGKLVLLGTPPDKGRRPVDAQQDERWLPDKLSSLRVRGLLPDVSVPVLRCSDDAVRVGSPIDRSNDLIVLRGHEERCCCIDERSTHLS